MAGLLSLLRRRKVAPKQISMTTVTITLGIGVARRIEEMLYREKDHRLSFCDRKARGEFVAAVKLAMRPIVDKACDEIIAELDRPRPGASPPVRW